MLNANPDLNVTLELWNTLENKYIQQGWSIILPYIRYNQLLFLPMTDTIITKDNVCSLPSYDPDSKPFPKVLRYKGCK